jgi:hypothetical protein
MKKLLPICILIAAILPFNIAIARDDHKMFSIEDALQSQAAKDKLDPAIKLYFGRQKHPSS